MVKKKKFKPVVTKIKLNPEQAVLQCSCYSTGYTGLMTSAHSFAAAQSACAASAKTTSNMASPGSFCYQSYGFTRKASAASS